MKKHFAFACLAVCLCMLCACNATRTTDMGANEAKNAYGDAHLKLHAGKTTLDDMNKFYGKPTDKADTADGFACRWVNRRTISKTIGGMPGNISSFDEGRMSGRYNHTITYVSELEAFFDKNGLLTGFRVNSDIK